MAGQLGIGIATFTQFAGQSIYSGAFGPANRDITRVVNQLHPNVVGGFDLGARCFNLNLCTLEFWKEHAAYDGINLENMGWEDTMYSRLSDNKIDLNPAPFNDTLTMMEKLAVSAKNVPSIDEAHVLFNRELITDALYSYILTANLEGEFQLANQYKELRFEVPSVSDLVQFAVKDCWNPQIVETFQYHLEYPLEIEKFLAWQGLHGKTDTGIPVGGTNNDGTPRVGLATWGDLYWWSHWQLPSPSQCFEMFHRFYLVSDYGPSPEVTPLNFFGQGELDLFLKTADYPPYWRQRLTDIAFMPLTRVDIRRMYQLGVIVEDGDLYHAYRAIGYNDRNAKLLLLFTKRQALGALKDISGLTFKELEKMYLEGIIGREETAFRMTGLGYDEGQVGQYLIVLDQRQSFDMVQRRKKIIKRGFMTGLIDSQVAYNALATLGLQTRWIEQTMIEWQGELLANHKRLGAMKLVEGFKKGFVNEVELARALGNLGYLPPEVKLMIDLAKFDLLAMQQRGLDRVLKERQKQIDAIKKAEQQAIATQAKNASQQATAIAKQAKEFRTLQNKAYTDKNIVNFYKGGFITIEQVVLILSERGWDATAIEAWIETYLFPKQ
jgi:hypothetical protein